MDWDPASESGQECSGTGNPVNGNHGVFGAG